MRCASINFDCSCIHQSLSSQRDRAGRINHIINQNAALAINGTDNVHDFSNVCTRTTLIDDCDRRLQEFSQLTGARHTAVVRRYDDCILIQTIRQEVIGQKRSTHQVVNRNIKETLNLCRMQIKHDCAICTGFFDHNGNKLGRNRFTATSLAVLARITIVRNNNVDRCRTGTTQSVNHDQKFHQVVIYRSRC